jgi:hypothetical protein
MFKSTMSPEAQAKFTARVQAERKASREALTARLQEKAAQEGPDSIWAEMLAERIAQ